LAQQNRSRGDRRTGLEVPSSNLGAPIKAPEIGAFPSKARSGEYLNADYLRKIVLAAMKAEGVPTIDAQSRRPRKPLHSWRATYARRMLEQGKHPQWVEAQLGHADLALTIGVYGAWTDDAMRAEAARA
jgi:integrase